MQKTKTTRPNSTYATEEPPSAATVSVDDLDAILDEIDACLEENALEVIRMYIARGGE